MRSLRECEDDDSFTQKDLAALEARLLRPLVDAIIAQQPEKAAEAVRTVLWVPDEAVEIMQKTPVGKMLKFPIKLSDLAARF